MLCLYLKTKALKKPLIILFLKNTYSHIILRLVWKHLKLEDLKVLRRSPDLLNNVKIGQGQLQLIMEQILFYHICCRHFGQVT